MLGFSLDGFDILMLSFMLTEISDALHLTSVQAGSLITWTLIGGAVGGSFFGVMADYFGRARILSISILIFSLCTLLCAFSIGYIDLFLYRFISGIGLGCEFGVGTILAMEAYPPKMRTRISSYVGMSWQFGVLGASLLTPFLLPYVGWRGMFLLGGAPAILAFFIRRSVSESKEFEATRRIGIPEFPVKALWHDMRTIKASTAILVMTTVQNFGYYGVVLWLPSYLVNIHHFSLGSSGLWAAISVVGMIAGIAIFGEISDRIGRKPAFLLYQAGAFFSVLSYAFFDTPFCLLIGGVVAGFFVAGMIGGYGALVTDLYPVHARSTAQNVLYSIGRALGGFGPMLVGLIVTHGSFQLALEALSGIYVFDFIVTASLIPKGASAAAHVT